MIRHLFKLAWNRKRSNALIVLEIVVSFIVVFAVATVAVYYGSNYGRPLGFSHERVWNVEIDLNQSSDDSSTPEQIETVRQLLLTAQSFPEVEAAAGSHMIPFSFSSSTGAFEPEGRSIEFDRSEVTDDVKDVLGLEVVRGRWFSREDDGANYSPVVINQNLARAFFGDEDPVGKDIDRENRTRVVGVVSEYRRTGELSAPGNALFERRTLDNPKDRPPRNILVKLRPNTPADFEERFLARLQAVARDWSLQVESLDAMRASTLQFLLAPLVVLALVATFLILMVGLGLMGVLWQNVTRRTTEIGVRRAQGATAGDVCAQIVGEVTVVATIGILIGTAIIAQLPLLDILVFLTPGVFFGGLALAAGVIYVLTIACSLYPGWLATRVKPAEALHYE
jgi:putative ABC transport system permease protein